MNSSLLKRSSIHDGLKIDFEIISCITCPWFCGSEVVLSFLVKWGIEQLPSA